MEDSVGCVVRSTAGRDAGRFFVIVEETDAQFVLIADGKVRKLAAPKKKKRKHLLNTGKTLDGIREKLVSGSKVFDSEIRNALESLGLNTKKGEE